jgi:hypothetical protein
MRTMTISTLGYTVQDLIVKQRILAVSKFQGYPNLLPCALRAHQIGAGLHQLEPPPQYSWRVQSTSEQVTTTRWQLLGNNQSGKRYWLLRRGHQCCCFIADVRPQVV